MFIANHVIFMGNFLASSMYAKIVLDAFGNTMGGPKWVLLTIPGLRAFIAMHIYMGLKR